MGTGYEVVRVIDSGWLIDAESYQRKYRAPEGRTLEPGCYVVGRPDDVEDTIYDERAEFIGPFASVRSAESALRGLNAGQRVPLLSAAEDRHLRPRP